MIRMIGRLSGYEKSLTAARDALRPVAQALVLAMEKLDRLRAQIRRGGGTPEC